MVAMLGLGGVGPWEEVLGALRSSNQNDPASLLVSLAGGS